ncbi:MAG: phosphonate ABC transporter ATP-binding protein [Bacteriovoracaceae bacterium]
MMLKISNLKKVYPNGLQALNDINLEVKKGEFLVIIGLSGSGKSTLLKCINKLHPVTEGKVIFNDQEISSLKGEEMRMAQSNMGMIFQHFNLIERKSALTNVLTGALHKTSIFKSLLELFSPEQKEEAFKMLDIVGLKDKAYERVDNLSGGQKQRVAIARALMQSPSLLLADEPVASLDPATSHSVMDYLKKVNEELGVTIICNLHFLSLVREYAQRVVALKDGQLIFEGKPEQIDEDWFRKIYGEKAKEVFIK